MYLLFDDPPECPGNARVARKRRRLLPVVEEHRCHPTSFHNLRLLRLDHLPSDLLSMILGFLPLDDIDTFSLTSKACNDARKHPCVVKTRTGTIVIGRISATPHTQRQRTAVEFLETIQDRNLRTRFKENRRRLRVTGLENLLSSKVSDVTAASRSLEVDGVKILDASYLPCLEPCRFRQVKTSVAKTLAMILPGLVELDLSYMRVAETAVDSFARHCPLLEVFRWKGSQGGLRINGENLSQCRRLKEIDVEGSQLYCSIRRNDCTPSIYDPNDKVLSDSIQLFGLCSRNPLERINIKGCVWYSSDIIINSKNPGEKHPSAKIPEETILRFIRRFSATLKSLHVDMSKECLEKAQKQGPDVMFL